MSRNLDFAQVSNALTVGSDDVRRADSASCVLDVVRGPYDINSIKMFRREAGKDFVVIVLRQAKNLPCISKRTCHDLLVLLYDLDAFWSSIGKIRALLSQATRLRFGT